MRRMERISLAGRRMDLPHRKRKIKTEHGLKVSCLLFRTFGKLQGDVLMLNGKWAVVNRRTTQM